MKILKAILALMLIQACQSVEDDCEPTSASVLVEKSSFFYWKYANIDTVDQLHFDCDVSKYMNYVNQSMFTLTLAFNMIVLDQTINLNAFAKLNAPFNLALLNLKGFDVERKGPLFKIDDPTFYRRINRMIQSSFFDFYRRGELIVAKNCDSSISDHANDSVFELVDSISFALMSWSGPVCPFVFANSRIRQLYLSNLEMDRMETQNLQFIELKNQSLDLNSAISEIIILNVFNYRLRTSMVDTRVFARTVYFSITGKILDIQSELFASFPQLCEIHLRFNNIREFFHASINAWLASLFNQGAVYAKKEDMSDLSAREQILLLTIIDEQTSYEYPVEDFCLFKYFPGNKAIFTVLKVWKHFKYQTPFSQGSCAARLLQQNNHVLNQLFSYFPDDSPELFSQDLLNECAFEEKMSMCLNLSFEEIRGEPKQYPSYYETVYVFKWIDFIGPVITFPILSALAFTLNLTIILVISSKKNKKESLFDAKIFHYMFANAAFNCIECLLYELRLVNICISFGSLYCSSVKSSRLALYVGTYVTGYAGETVKTCSALTGVLFSIQRYIDTSKTQSKVLLRISKFKTRNILGCVAVVSLLVSVSKIFETSTNLVEDSPYDSPIQFKMNFLASDSISVWICLYFFHYIFNDFVLLVINMAIDVKLVLIIRRDMAKKLRFVDGNSSVDQKLFEKKKALELKTNLMIILNVVIFACCRIPELGTYMFVFFYQSFHKTRLADCSSQIFCYLLADFSEYLYMLAYSLNIFIYYKFNSNFYTGFRNFLGLKSSSKVGA